MIIKLYRILKWLVVSTLKLVRYILKMSVRLVASQLTIQRCEPKHWMDRHLHIYLLSSVGRIKYSTNNLKEMTAFRNKYVNRFMLVSQKPSLLKYYGLYFEILLKHRKGVSYKANLITRFVGLMLSPILFVRGVR